MAQPTLTLMSLVVSLFLVPTSSKAQIPDVAELVLIGFSEDGRYMAFEQYGAIRGAMIYWSSIYFIEVPNNTWAAQPIESGENDGLESLAEVRQMIRAKAQPQLEKLGIVESNKGQLVLSHLYSDTGVDPHRAQFKVYPPVPSNPYDLVLKEIDTGKTHAYLGAPCYMFSLTMEPSGGSAPTILQEDRALPESRARSLLYPTIPGCPLGYRIQDVYLYRGKENSRDEYIVVFLNMYVRAFESIGMSYLAVAGVFER